MTMLQAEKKADQMLREAKPGALRFSVDKMFRLPDAGSLKAFLDVTINDAVTIKGIRILEGKKGLFVGMLKEQGKDNRWYDQITFTNTGVYDQFSEACLDHYREAQEADRV